MNKRKVVIPLVTAVGLVSGVWVSDISAVSAQQVQTGTFSVADIKVETGADIKARLPFDAKLVIRFTTPVEPYTVDDSALFVTDEFGTRASVTKTFTDQDKTIIVKPPSNGYEPGRTYTLHVKTDIYAKSGKQLSQPIKQSFTIQNEIVSIQGDETHTFFLGPKGAVWRSGKESFLPAEKEQDKTISTPQAYKELTGVNTIVKGKAHYLALKEDGTVWAWGENKSGELGDGTTQSKNVPTQIKELTDVTSVIAANDAEGNGYSLALKKDGTVWAWGSNKYGQLGVGDWNGTTVAKPRQIQDFRDITFIASGTGSVFAVKSDGKVYAWGDNRMGQLGDDSTQTRYRPVKIEELKDVEGIVAGKNYALAYQKDGNVYAWGSNEFGQLGNGSSSPSDIPVQVTGLSGVKQLIIADNSNFALKNDGTVWSWGQNEKGQLGDGSTNNRFIPFQIGSMTHIQSISVSGKNGIALDEDGKVWTWGQPQTQLEADKKNENSAPVQLRNLSNIKQIWAKSNSYFAVEKNGTVWAWGENNAGQLGDGTSKSQPVPVKIPAF
jgi:alpha-tubulin suppressor-like RCC1 family protein